MQVKARDQLPSNPGATAHKNSEAHAQGTRCLAGLRAQARRDGQIAAAWGPLSQPLLPTLGKMVEGQKDLGGKQQSLGGRSQARGPEGSRHELSKGPSSCTLHVPAHLFCPARWSYRAGCPESCAPALPTPSPSRWAAGQGSRSRALSLPGAPRVRALCRDLGWAAGSPPVLSWDTFRFAAGIRAEIC